MSDNNFMQSEDSQVEDKGITTEPLSEEDEHIQDFAPAVLAELIKEGRLKVGPNNNIDTSGLTLQELQNLLSASASSVKVTRTSAFNGPIPPPQIIAEYKNIQSDFPERIMAMAERQQAHRHRIENKATNAEILMAILGWSTPTIVIILAIVAAYNLLMAGKNVEAFVSVIIGLATLLAAYYHKKRNIESEENQTINDEE